MASLLRFGVFELNPETEELRKFGILVKLPPQPFKVLVLLASKPGKLVTREQIQQEVWGEETFVDFEQGMNQCIKQIRTVLSDSAETPRYIETLPRRGYRFIAPVELMDSKSGISRALVLPKTPPESEQPIAVSNPIPAPPVAPPVASPAVYPTSAAVDTSAVAATRATPPAVITPSPIRGKSPLRAAIVVLLLCALGAATYFWFASRKNQAEKLPGSSFSSRFRRRRSVAILGFQNVSQSPGTAYISTALDVMLTTELGAGGELRVISAEDVRRMKLGLQIGDSDSLAPDTLRRIRKTLGADYVVLGSYTDLGDKIHLDVRVQDTASGEMIASAGATGSKADFFDLVSSAGADIRPKLGMRPVSMEETNVVRDALPTTTEAVRLYSQGIAKLRAFDLVGARALLEQAISAEPAYALAHSALGETLELQGDDKGARKEAQKAFELPANLRAEDKLLIEARYRAINGEGDAAIALYRELHSDFPDNLDYGLKLANAETKAGKAKDALVTIESLRQFPAPERDDPRIDLAEAAAADSLGDYQHEQAAATRAVDKAGKLGSALELARAQIVLGRSLYYQNKLDDALTAFQAALATAEKSGDAIEQASALNNIASILLAQQHYAEAQSVYEKALDRHREIGNLHKAAATLSNLATVLVDQQDFSGAVKTYQQALDVYEEFGDKRHVGIVLNNMGDALYLSGDLPGAKAKHEQALAIDRQTDDALITSEALSSLGDVQNAESDSLGARKSYEEALKLQEAIHDEELAPQTRRALAGVMLEMGDAAGAEAAARKIADRFREKKMPDEEAKTQDLLARALLAQKKLPAAQVAIAQATSLASQSADRTIILQVAITAARVQAASGTSADAAQAMNSLQQVLTEAARKHYVSVQFEASLALGEVELESGHAGEGRARLQALELNACAQGFRRIAREAAEAMRQPARSCQSA